MPRRRYNGKVLHPSLFFIGLHVLTIQDHVARKYKSKFQEFLDNLIVCMKDDECFNALFKRCSYQGSTYERTKIIIPNEFDINVELRLSDFFEMKIDVRDTYPGYARLQLNEWTRVPNKRVLRKINEEWLDDDQYLCLDDVLSWFQSVVDRALNRMRDDRVTRRQNGPAITLYVEMDGIKQFSVDFVPSIFFETEDLPNWQYRILTKMSRIIGTDLSNLGWHLVPKRARDENGSIVDDVTQWRMSLYLYERAMMHDLPGMKPAFRLMKFLRQRQGWNSLCSYYIKTLFLWELQREGAEYWRSTGLGDLFFNMLECLEECLKNKNIPFFWDKRCNLVEHVSDQQLEEAYNTLQEFITDLQDAEDDDDDEETKKIVGEMFDVPVEYMLESNPTMAPLIDELIDDITA